MKRREDISPLYTGVHVNVNNKVTYFPIPVLSVSTQKYISWFQLKFFSFLLNQKLSFKIDFQAFTVHQLIALILDKTPGPENTSLIFSYVSLSSQSSEARDICDCETLGPLLMDLLLDSLLITFVLQSFYVNISNS